MRATVAAAAVALVLILGAPTRGQGRPIDVAREDHKVGRRLLYSSAKDDAERLKQLREAVRLLERAKAAVDFDGGGDEGRILRDSVEEDLATARKKLAPLEPTPAPTPPPTVARPDRQKLELDPGDAPSSRRAELERAAREAKADEETERKAQIAVGGFSFGLIAVVVVVGVLFVFAPYSIAARRKHPAAGMILVATILFSWTLVGWILLMILALMGGTSPEEQADRAARERERRSMATCPACKERIQRRATVCKHCGERLS